MKDTAVHFALREMQRHFRDPRVLAAMAIVGCMLGFAGPFGTFDLLPTGPRVAYWLAIVGITYVVGWLVGAIAERALRAAHPLLRAVLAGLLVGPPVTAAVVFVNWLSFGTDVASLEVWLGLLSYCTVIAVGVTGIVELVASTVARAAATAPAPATNEPAPDALGPPLLERVPAHVRAPLLSLSVSDHYVEVVTRRGRALVLMRLGDAVREAGATPGLRIHRSHWIALDAVRGVSRRSGRVSVELVDGRQLPVSRSYVEDARQAGLLV